MKMRFQNSGTTWSIYRILPPQLNPQTMDPIGPEDLAPLFPMGLILQEVSDQSYIDIPEPVLDLYAIQAFTDVRL